MTAEQAIDQLYKVAEDEDLMALDYLMVRAGFRTPTSLLASAADGDHYVGGEMRALNDNSIETIEEMRDSFVPYAQR